MPTRGTTHTLGDRVGAPAPAAAPYVRSEHAINWGSQDPFVGTWQYDENGYPIGPGGFRYTGAQHEFSGGVGQQNVAQINGAQGGPSYAQWIEEVRRIQGEKAKQATAESQARAVKYGNPAAQPGANPAAVAWLNAHPNNGPIPTATPDPPPLPPQGPPTISPPLPPTPAPGGRNFGGVMPPTAVNDPFAVPSPGVVPVDSASAPASSPAAAAAPPAHPAPAATAPVPSPFGVTPRPLQPSQALTTTAGASGVGARPATPAPTQPFTMSKPVATTQRFGMDAMKAAGTKPPSPMPTFSRTRSPFDIPGMR